MTYRGDRYPQLAELDRDQVIALLEDAAKNWLAHDGLWFQAVEREHGMAAAVSADTEAWRRFTEVEAKRIMQRHAIAEGGGIPALVRALSFRLYAYINVQTVVEQDDRHALFRMVDCRVQSARKRHGLPDFPCKSVGLVEYEGFARAIDPRIRTRCRHCPPDPHPDNSWCEWEFHIE